MKIFSFKSYIILCLLLFFSFPASASAHILATDNNIGSVLHIDPEDDPIVGQQASFFFEFKDKENKFKPQNCDCTFSLIEGGKQIYSQPLFQNNDNPSLNTASIFYTFPQKDVYKVTIIGKPTSPDAFQPFTLNYNVRVSRIADEQTTDTPNNNWFLANIGYLSAGGIVIIFLIFAFIKKHKQKKGGEKDNEK